MDLREEEKYEIEVNKIDTTMPFDTSVHEELNKLRIPLNENIPTLNT